MESWKGQGQAAVATKVLGQAWGFPALSEPVWWVGMVSIPWDVLGPGPGDQDYTVRDRSTPYIHRTGWMDASE